MIHATPPSTTPTRRLLLPVAIVLGLLVALLLPAGEASALGKVKCDVSGQPAVAVGSYDPIVNHNSPGPSMHEHQFFGNIAWHSLANPNAANYADLVGKATNCRNVLGLSYSADSAGYWTPTLRYVSGARPDSSCRRSSSPPTTAAHRVTRSARRSRSRLTPASSAPGTTGRAA